MENSLKQTGKTLSILGALTASIAQGADLEQLQTKYEQQLSQAPEAVTKVLQSGEGCDLSLLNQALETGDEDDYLVCADIERLDAEIKLAKTEQALIAEKAGLKSDTEALAKEDKDIAELTQANHELDTEHEKDKTTIAVLTKREAEIEQNILSAVLRP